MSPLQYELLAGAMRFVFVPLFLFLLWRSGKNAWLEYRIEKKHIGDVGVEGDVMGSAALVDEWQDDDAWRPVYDDTVIGSAADCNFRVRGHGLRGKHARIYFERGRAYVERLCGDSDVLLVDNAIVIDKALLNDGSHIMAGEAEVILSLFTQQAGADDET